MPLLIVILGVLALFLLITVFRLHAFIAFILVALGVGIAEGMDLAEVVASLQKGIGGTLGFLIMILGFGAMLGKLVAESGAAQRITSSLVEAFGVKRVQLALILTGFIVGIPMFYTVGFVILVPLVFTVAATTRLPLVYVGLPMLSSLSVTHGFLPPHPAPTAIATMFGADLGMTLLYGIIVAIPAIILAGPVFSLTLKKYNPTPRKDLFEVKVLSESEMPGLALSIFCALLPVLLIGADALAGLWLAEDNPLKIILSFIGNPVIAMLVSVLVAVLLLGLLRGKKMKDLMETLSESIKGITLVLLIIGGAGGLKQVLTDSGVSDFIAEMLIGSSVSPLILAWGIAAVIRVCVGSATVAGLTTAGIILPLVATAGVKPELMVLATGAGSLMFSHVNDGGFWLFKEYFNMSIKDTLMTWSVMETIVSTAGLLGVLVLNWVG